MLTQQLSRQTGLQHPNWPGVAVVSAGRELKAHWLNALDTPAPAQRSPCDGRNPGARLLLRKTCKGKRHFHFPNLDPAVQTFYLTWTGHSVEFTSKVGVDEKESTKPTNN